MYCVFCVSLLRSFHFYIMGFKFPPLTSHNYATWKDIAWSRLMEKGYSLYVDGTITQPSDQQGLGVIRSCVHGDLLFHIKNCSTSKEAWDKLEQLYGKVDAEKGFQIEDDLILLDPKNYDTI